MKRYFNKITLYAAFGLLLLSSCEKDTTNVNFQGGTAPALTSSVTGDTIPLPVTDTTAIAAIFSWTNPNYQFSNGVSSMNVTYYLQVDTLGANFTSPNMQSVSINSDLMKAFTVAQFNAIIGNGLQLSFGDPHHIQIRIQSFIQPFTSASPVAGQLFSDTLNYVVTPFAPPPAVTPPASGTLFIVGSAVPVSGWSNPISPASNAAVQQFTQVSPTDYTLTTTIVGAGEFKFISVNGSWTDQWSPATNDAGPGPFVYNGKNGLAPPTSGTYLIEVNFQTGIFTMTAQ